MGLATAAAPRCDRLRAVIYCADDGREKDATERRLAYVRLREGEDGENLLKRFQTTMQRSGILRDLRNRRFFRSKGEQERLDKQRSLRRMRRKRKPR
jgi:small subunit ribosomal protein S21